MSVEVGREPVDKLREQIDRTWQSGGAGREALSEELGLLHPIIGAKWAVKRYGVVVEESGVREGNPSVLRDGYTYRIYNTRRPTSTGTYSIVSRTSSDGKSWSAPTTVMTADMVNAAGYNVTGAFQPCVVKKDGTYYMFFAGDQMQTWGSRANQIFLATSNDGVSFGNIRAVLTPVRNSMEGAIWHPYVVEFKRKYYMYCLATDTRLPSLNSMCVRIMLYTSANLTDWERVGAIALEGAVGEWDGGCMHDHSVVNVEDRLLIMVYAAESTAGSMDMRIGLCYSFDGLNWYSRRMLLARVLGSEVKFIADSSILYEGGKLKIWYEGDDGVIVGATGQSTVRVNYAEAVMADNHVMELWNSKTVPVAGLSTDDVDTKFDKKTFYIISNQAGTLNVQAYDEAAGDFKTFDSMPVSASVLTPYTTYYNARRMRLNFVPSAEATVSAWVAMN
jgi:predicted GH43/DUF377 family glycosyl hydrolase